MSDYEVIEDSAIDKVIDMSVKGLKNGLCAYTNNDQGMEQFRDRSIEYLESIRAENHDIEDIKKKVIPSIEGWCVYLGISRVTLLNYSRNYSPEFRALIDYIKTLIYSAKTQAAENGIIPPVLMIFDKCNNYGYLSTNQFERTADYKEIEVNKVEYPALGKL